METVYGFCENKCKMPVLAEGHILHCTFDVENTFSAGTEYGVFFTVDPNEYDVSTLSLIGASFRPEGGTIPSTEFNTILPVSGGNYPGGISGKEIDIKWGANPNTNQVMCYMYANFSDTDVTVSIKGKLDAIFWQP